MSCYYSQCDVTFVCELDYNVSPFYLDPQLPSPEWRNFSFLWCRQIIFDVGLNMIIPAC